MIFVGLASSKELEHLLTTLPNAFVSPRTFQMLFLPASNVQRRQRCATKSDSTHRSSNQTTGAPIPPVPILPPRHSTTVPSPKRASAGTLLSDAESKVTTTAVLFAPFAPPSTHYNSTSVSRARTNPTRPRSTLSLVWWVVSCSFF